MSHMGDGGGAGLRESFGARTVKPIRAYVLRSLARGMVWWLFAGVALATRELYVFHPDLFGV